MTVIKPCPFCGEEINFDVYSVIDNFTSDNINVYRYSCGNCGLIMINRDYELLVSGWNKRNNQEKLENEIFELKKDACWGVSKIVQSVDNGKYYQWKPLCEKLPPENGTVLACTNKGRIGILNILYDLVYGYKYLFYPELQNDEKIFYWMPLPELPEVTE